MTKLVLALLTHRSGLPKPSRRRFQEGGKIDGLGGAAMPSTDEILVTPHVRLDNGDRRARKREARRAKRLLAGSNHRQRAAPSLKGQGKALDNTFRKERKGKKCRNIKATVCQYFQGPEVNCEYVGGESAHGLWR
jgi:hypothetical protein